MDTVCFCIWCVGVKHAERHTSCTMFSSRAFEHEQGFGLGSFLLSLVNEYIYSVTIYVVTVGGN